MTLFLLTFLLVYGGLHLYFFVKMNKAFPLDAQQRIGLIVFLGAMVLLPFIERMLVRMGYELPACGVALVGYSWMGLIFFFFHIALLFDLYHLLLRTGSFLSHRDLSHLTASARVAFLVPLVFSTAIAVYGYIAAQHIVTETITIKSAKIPVSTGKIRIVQMSDIHIGMIIGEERLQGMLREVIKANPDILISTGDMVDGQIDGLSSTKALLKNLKPRYGKFAITGNHEFYAGLDQFLSFTAATGFTVLRGEGVTVAGLINIVGVDDSTGLRSGQSLIIPEKVLLSRLPKEKFTLLLKHKPIVENSSVGLFDLQLSGHTHQGQIFPFSLFTKIAFPYHSGYFNLPGGSRLYVSRGTGTWGPPMRFLASPEITVIDLVPEEKG